ncbi:hypothetical protein CPAV1605_49 [seawater metagenome]|uniref:Uncharacterized protein n=1 Tax=seawater metagenome TaxID=1561972 RepID=A0A5E8CH28_9ZZZZ
MSISSTVNKFNDYIEEMLTQLNNCVNDEDIKLYKGMFTKLRRINSSKAIEQFIIHVLPYKDKIVANDESFFLNHDEASLLNDDNEESIMKALKFKELWSSISNNSKENLFKFFQVLIYYAEEYFKMKYKNLVAT